jgi:hypothetical protein
MSGFNPIDRNDQLSKYNPYGRGRILKYNDGTEELEREFIKWDAGENDHYHLLKNGETLDKVAYDFYHDIVQNADKYWWVIADANIVENPLDLSQFIGTEILIPDIKNFLLNNG